MKYLLFIAASLFILSCSNSREDEPEIKIDKYYLYKEVDIIDGVVKTQNHSGNCRAKTNIYIDVNNKVIWQNFYIDTVSQDCINNTANYYYDPEKKKIQFFSYLYYSVKYEGNILILQSHMEENDDPNYTTIYYFRKN